MGGTFRWQTCSTSDFPLKRSKVIEACQLCRTKKMRCDGNQPCSRCVKDKKRCEYKATTNLVPRSDDKKPRRTTVTVQQEARAWAMFQWSKLNKLSFHHDLYTAINFSPSPRTAKLPPLLFDFYHLTAQPITIWTRLHLLFQKWTRLQKPSSSSPKSIPFDLAKEAAHLFFEYNTLYPLFIDSSDITDALNSESFYPSSLSSTPTTAATTRSLLLDTILGLTFLAAGQTLGSDSLMDVARLFYHTVHQRWLAMTFPTATPGSSDTQDLKRLIQTAILLIHFQCTDICEEQAYMTTRIAQGCLERLLSTDPSLPSTALQLTLHAWQIWFALYLYGGQSLVSPVTSLTTMIPTQSVSSSPREQQLWTWSVLTRYAVFMESLLKPNQDPTMTIHDMVEKTQSLSSLSTMNTKAAPSTSLSSSEQLVDLYHTILTIQLFSTQWLPHLSFFSFPAKPNQPQQQHHLTGNIDEGSDNNETTSPATTTSSSSSSNDTIAEERVTSPSVSKKLCIETSQRIIEMVSTMMATGQDITSHRSSSPSLLPIRYRALCLAATILVPLGRHQPLTDPSLSDSFQQLKQILDQDTQIWPMARQYLYHLQQSLPDLFPIDDDMTLSSSIWPMVPERPGSKKRDHIDQEQLNKLSIQHDQLSNFVHIGKRSLDQRTTDDDPSLYTAAAMSSQELFYAKKRPRTFPASNTPFWIPTDMNGTSPFLAPENATPGSLLLSSSGASASTSSTASLLMSPTSTFPYNLQHPPLMTASRVPFESYPMIHQSSASSASSASSITSPAAVMTMATPDLLPKRTPLSRQEEWLYYLYQHPHLTSYHQHHHSSGDDAALMIFSSSLPSLPRK